MSTGNGGNDDRGPSGAPDTSEVLLEGMESRLEAVRTRLAAEGPQLGAVLQQLLVSQLGAYEHMVSVLISSVRARSGDTSLSAYDREVLSLEAGLAALEQGVAGDARVEAAQLRTQLDTLESKVLGAADLLARYRDARDATLEAQAQQLAALARRLAVIEQRLSQ